MKAAEYKRAFCRNCYEVCDFLSEYCEMRLIYCGWNKYNVTMYFSVMPVEDFFKFLHPFCGKGSYRRCGLFVGRKWTTCIICNRLNYCANYIEYTKYTNVAADRINLVKAGRLGVTQKPQFANI